MVATARIAAAVQIYVCVFFLLKLTAKNRDHFRDHTLGNRVWATVTFFSSQRMYSDAAVHGRVRELDYSRVHFMCCLQAFTSAKHGNVTRGVVRIEPFDRCISVM